MGSGGENLAFTDRAIARVQRLSIEDGIFPTVITEYLIRRGRLAYDIERNLFWVTPTNGQPEVAVWMMPVCIAAEA